MCEVGTCEEYTCIHVCMRIMCFCACKVYMLGIHTSVLREVYTCVCMCVQLQKSEAEVRYLSYHSPAWLGWQPESSTDLLVSVP